MNVLSSEQLLLPSETADRLRIEEGTLATWRSTRSQPLPYVKIGAAVRYRAQDVDQFITKRLHAA